MSVGSGAKGLSRHLSCHSGMIDDNEPLPVRVVCLSCGGEVQRWPSEWSIQCKACGFEWRGCQARGGEDMMYRPVVEKTTWADLEWWYVPAGCLAVFGEIMYD